MGGEGGLGEPTLEVRAEDKLIYTMPYEEEEDRGREVKCPRGGGVCGIGSTPILLPLIKQHHRRCPIKDLCMNSSQEGMDEYFSL